MNELRITSTVIKSQKENKIIQKGGDENEVPFVMHKILEHKDLYDLMQQRKIPGAILAMIHADLDLIEANYANGLDKPYVIIIDHQEWISHEPDLAGYDKADYEARDIIFLDHEQYVEKILYLDVGIDTGVYYYLFHPFGRVVDYFNGNKYITANADRRIPLDVQVRIWDSIESAQYETRMDYLQVFEIKQEKDTISVIHRQEQPAYSRIFRMKANVGDVLVYVISSFDENSNEYSTLLMAEDY